MKFHQKISEQYFDKHSKTRNCCWRYDADVSGSDANQWTILVMAFNLNTLLKQICSSKSVVEWE